VQVRSICSAGFASRRCLQVSSNVRPHTGDSDANLSCSSPRKHRASMVRSGNGGVRPMAAIDSQLWAQLLGGVVESPPTRTMNVSSSVALGKTVAVRQRSRPSAFAGALLCSTRPPKTPSSAVVIDRVSATVQVRDRYGSIGGVKKPFPTRLRSKVRPNLLVKRSANGKPPGPVCRCTAHCLRPGPGVLPLSPAYLKR
jgi:hypothetical protein